MISTRTYPEAILRSNSLQSLTERESYSMVGGVCMCGVCMCVACICGVCMCGVCMCVACMCGCG